MKQLVRLLVIDDHALFRESVSRLLQAQPGLGVVGSCGSLGEALRLMQAGRVDVVLLDYDLQEESGLEFLEQAKSQKFEAKILLVTAAMGRAMILRAFELAAAGIFFKQAPPVELVEAIRRIANGEIRLGSGAAKSLIQGFPDRTQLERIQPSFTVREQNILRAILEGMSNKEIAGELSLSESAVRTILQKLYIKAGVRTRSQLVRVILENRSVDWLGTSNLTRQGLRENV